MSTILLRSFLELRTLKSVKFQQKRAGRAVLADRDLSAEMLEQLEGDIRIPTDVELRNEVAAEIQSDLASRRSSPLFTASEQEQPGAACLSVVNPPRRRRSYGEIERYHDDGTFVNALDEFGNWERWLCHCDKCSNAGVSVLNTMLCKDVIAPVERTIESEFLTELYCVGAYRWALDKERWNSLSVFIRSMKIQQMEHLPCLLGRLVVDALTADAPELLESSCCVIPVPADPLRVEKRGFDNVAAIGSWISEFSFVPLNTETLVKSRPTEDLRTVPSEKRIDVIRGAFSVLRPSAVKGRQILLFDDVVTSGSTLNECARVLLNHGAHSVSAVTLGMSEGSRG